MAAEFVKFAHVKTLVNQHHVCLRVSHWCEHIKFSFDTPKVFCSYWDQAPLDLCGCTRGLVQFLHPQLNLVLFGNLVVCSHQSDTPTQPQCRVLAQHLILRLATKLDA